MGAGVRILQNDSVKSGSESMAKAALVQPLVHKPHSCSELTEHKLSLVQRLFRDKALTTPAPVTIPIFLGRGSPNQTATSAQHRNTLSHSPTKGIGAHGMGEICSSQLEVELMTEP